MELGVGFLGVGSWNKKQIESWELTSRRPAVGSGQSESPRNLPVADGAGAARRKSAAARQGSVSRRVATDSRRHLSHGSKRQRIPQQRERGDGTRRGSLAPPNFLLRGAVALAQAPPSRQAAWRRSRSPALSEKFGSWDKKQIGSWELTGFCRGKSCEECREQFWRQPLQRF